MDDLISVIVPVYNAEKYIERCVKSIQNQTYAFFELILVNDGSEDNSLKICKEMAQEDERIIVLNRANGGASAARNMGLKKMSGQYVVFADSDDYVSPSYIENLYLAAKKGRYDIVQCNMKSTDDIEIKPEKIQFESSDLHEITKRQALNERKYKVSVWGKIYASHIFRDFQFKEGIIYEDDASYYIFVDRAQKLGILNETLYFYFMSENSVMRNEKGDKSDAFIGIYEDRIHYFKNKKENVLLEGTYDRFCLVLMLSLSSSYEHGNNIKDRKRWLTLFRRYYPLVMKAQSVYTKDKVMFSLFRVFPRMTGAIVGKIRG